MVLMYDSVDPFAIPLSAAVVAGYVDGLYAWPASGWERFPGAVHVSIATQASSSADVLDVERGDATVSQVPGWCDRFARPGRRAPTVYCSRSAMTAVQAAVGSRRVDLWVSTLDGSTDVPGASVVQYRDAGAWDESVVVDLGWIGWETDTVQYLLSGQPVTNADLVARRVKIHEWVHIQGSVVSPSGLSSSVMDSLLSLWIQSGAEAVFAHLLGA